jgi:ferric-dicitrate binding protein FerR (iron transport regulator)
MVVGPESELELPTLEASDRVAEALQDRGTVDYEVADGDAGGLDVVTPYLVATVEAAAFRVTIADGRSIVDVFEGTVVVTSRLDGTAATLVAGQGATVDAESTAGLHVRSTGGEAVARNR